MPRPLMQHGVGQLEELFARSKSDAKVLKQLEHELTYRQVPRAIALLDEVQAAMKNATATAKPVVPLPPTTSSSPPSAPGHMQQPSLWERPDTLPGPEPSTAPPVRPTVVPVKPAEPSRTAKVQASTMPLDDAHKVLKVLPGASWESIEQTRRTLVQSAHPSRLSTMTLDRRDQALADARRVNAAYVALSQSRCGSR